jgi:general L-amino acid transport system substrate-binding protein
MTRAVALFLALLMTAVPLAGCTGDDTELNAANERITELESQAEADQAKIAELEDEQSNLLETIGAQTVELENLCCTLEEMAIQYQYGYGIGYDDGWYDGYDGAASSGGSSSTLDQIISRGYMKCGVKESQYGMGYLDWDTGVRSGLDIEYCKAVAAAIGLDPEVDIEYIPASGSDRFDKLASGTIDVLIRTTTWTTSRDADLNADFAGINFYDGQGILVNTDAYEDAPTSVLDLNGANICVGIGTTTEGNIADYFAANGIEYTAVNTANWGDAMSSFESGECDAMTGDMSGLVANKWSLDTNAVPNSAIMPELLSKEPLAAATRDYDSDWNEIVSWVWWGMITAEEFGITSENYMNADTSNPFIDRLLNQNLGLGTTQNPLSATWMQDVLEAVGNYGEAYDRSFCDGDGTHSNCLIDRAGTMNGLVSQGGLQYAPPMR